MMQFFDRYRGAIFDLDGTLADSMGLWEGLSREWLRMKGREAPEGLSRVLNSMTIRESTDYMIRHFTPDETPEGIAAQWEAMVIDRYRESIPLKDGAEALLRRLSERGLKLALASSCIPAAAEAFLAARNIRRYFSAILFTDQVKRNKSFPDIWLAAAEKLGLPPGDCVVFEDLYAALPGVRAAGMGFAAVYDDSCENWPALSAGADLALDSFAPLTGTDRPPGIGPEGRV
jgi:HAD superfamily hydrolase (TIGR01509 family)